VNQSQALESDNFEELLVEVGDRDSFAAITIEQFVSRESMKRAFVSEEVPTADLLEADYEAPYPEV